MRAHSNPQRHDSEVSGQPKRPSTGNEPSDATLLLGNDIPSPSSVSSRVARQDFDRRQRGNPGLPPPACKPIRASDGAPIDHGVQNSASRFRKSPENEVKEQQQQETASTSPIKDDKGSRLVRPAIPERLESSNQYHDESRQAFDDTQAFDFEDYANGKQSHIWPHIEKHIEEFTRQYVSKHVKNTSKGLSAAAGVTPTAVESSQQQSRRPSSTQDTDEWEDPSFCCPKSKFPPLGTSRDIFYCCECAMTYCAKCWTKQPLHNPKRKKPGHEKADPAMTRIIEATLDVNISDGEQTKLHLLDELASWFGAIRDHDEVVFRDHGRYASLMAEHSLAHRKRSYPALISFVGDTGAGKSSLIKLLIKIISSKLFQSEDSSAKVRQVSD